MEISLTLPSYLEAWSWTKEVVVAHLVSLHSGFADRWRMDVHMQPTVNRHD